MVPGASSGDSSSSGLYSPVESKTAIGFNSYAEYLSKLERSPVVSDLSDRDEMRLWLASFDGEGHCMEWSYCNLSNQNRFDVPEGLPAKDGTGFTPHTSALSSHDFRTSLQSPAENVVYRVVIANCAYHGPDSRMEDILGLGLDLGPATFDYTKTCLKQAFFANENDFPRPWYKDCPALQIGESVLCILEAVPEEARKTAILFLGSSGGTHFWEPAISTGSVMYPSQRPSQIREGLSDAVDQPQSIHYNTWLVQRFITSGVGMSNYFGAGNFLYVCLAALTELHLSTAPCYVPHMEQEGDDPKMPLKYRGRYLVDKKTAVTQMHSSSDLWIALREEVDEQRTALRWISRFSRKHFDHKNQNLQADFDDIMERFTLRVQDLEQSESQFRDYLAVEGTRNSILMAEMSIRESKRVMLLTALAFVFLPFSLASSVYGMNVQEINSSGHPIRAFIITGVAMCASSVAVWAIAAAYQSRLAYVQRKRGSPEIFNMPWYDTWILRSPYVPLRLMRWFRDVAVGGFDILQGLWKSQVRRSRF